MKSIMKIALGIVVGVVLLIGGCTAIIGSAMSGSDSDDKNAAERATEDRKAAKGSGSGSGAETEKSAPSMTSGQENALAKAEMYLDTQAFSKPGLVKQLKFEGFSEPDATFAVNQLEVDWNEQSAAKAEQYLDTQPFSRDGLIKQLKFEGFTDAEANYGVKKAGL